MEQLNKIRGYLCVVMPNINHDINVISKNGGYIVEFHGFQGVDSTVNLAAEDCLNKLIQTCLISYING